jgi:hypothetical protein
LCFGFSSPIYPLVYSVNLFNPIDYLNRILSIYNCWNAKAAFSLETVCSPESLGPLADRPESVIVNLRIPLFLRATAMAGGGGAAASCNAAGGGGGQFLQPKDVSYCLAEIMVFLIFKKIQKLQKKINLIFGSLFVCVCV